MTKINFSALNFNKFSRNSVPEVFFIVLSAISIKICSSLVGLVDLGFSVVSEAIAFKLNWTS